MREINIKLYQFSELSEEAQKRAYNDDPKTYMGDSYNSDFEKTLEAFENLFNIRVYRWNVDAYSYNFDFHQNDGDNADDIENPLRLAAYVWNNHAPHLKKGKYYSKSRWNGETWKTISRRSRVIFSMGDCPLTGVFCDCDILAPVLDCLLYRKMFDTYDDLITDCLEHFFRTWRDCLEYAESIEYYAEEAAANEWEYTADGRRWPR